jgi:hypothetical protein
VDKDIDDTRRELPEAAARFLSALERGDLDKQHQAMTDVAARCLNTSPPNAV